MQIHTKALTFWVVEITCVENIQENNGSFSVEEEDPVESNIYRNLRRRREILETYPVTLGKDERKTPKYSPKSASCGGFKTWS